MLNHIIVRENAGHELSLYLVMGTGSRKPEMIELQVRSPRNRPAWLNAFRYTSIAFYLTELKVLDDISSFSGIWF